MKNRSAKRFVSVICAAAMLFSSIGNSLFSVKAIADDSAIEQASSIDEIVPVTESEPELCHQSIDLYPNGEDAEQVIMLDGLMPEGATAEAKDVSDEHEGCAAYDITINDGNSEYQPGEENPIRVEITDPQIPESGNLSLWHISDNGDREQIYDFTFEDGKISFFAEAFSVYLIVDDAVEPYTGESGWKKIDTIKKLAKESPEGVYIGFYNGTYFFTSHQENNVGGTLTRTGITKTKKPANNTTEPDTAYRESDGETYRSAKYYFEDIVLNSNKTVIDSCKIYCIDNGAKKYLKQDEKSLSLVSAKSSASSFSVEAHAKASDNTQYIICSSDIYCCNMQGGSNGSAFAAYSGKTDDNAKLSFWYYEPLKKDPYGLDGKTYGLMNFTGGTHGYTLMADGSGDNAHCLVELVTHQTANADGVTLYVDEGSQTTRWTFHSTSEDKYKLSAETEEGVKYLAISGNDLTLADSAENASEFKVSVDSSAEKIQLSNEGKYVSFISVDNGESTSTSFSMTQSSGTSSWLNFLDFATLSDSDLITYSADRISVSDAQDGQKVIVYTRIWNEENKKYDIYAVDYNGTLYPCYASGGKILWLGDGTGSLEWVFTEYRDEVTKKPNYYYELYNPYSENILLLS